MKNILAENMLRFGVKNLNRTDISAVQRLLNELKDPAVEGTTKQVGAGTKEDPKRYVWSVSCTYADRTGAKQTIYGTCISTDGKTGWKPGTIRIPLGSSAAMTTYTLTYDAATNVYTLATAPTWADLTYGGPGNIPVNAVTEILKQIQTKTGNTYTRVSEDISSGLQSMKNMYSKTSGQIAGTGICSPGKWYKTAPANPETGDITGNIELRTSDGAVRITIPAAGSIDETTMVYWSGSERSFSMTIKKLADHMSLKGSDGNLSLAFTDNKGADSENIKTALITQLNSISNNLAIK